LTYFVLLYDHALQKLRDGQLSPPYNNQKIKYQKSEIIYFCVAANGWIGTILVKIVN